MQYCCFACLQELPSSTREEEWKSLHNLQCNEDLAKMYHRKTGIVINATNDYPKHLCEICFNKIRAFDDFWETALDCSTALYELLLEEDFPLRTLKNLQHFCSTCLNQIKDEAGDSLNLNNAEVKRWLEKCNTLKIRTGTNHWPNSICERCCKRIDDFLEFQYTAKQALKQISPQHRNIQNTNYQAEKHINLACTSPLVENARKNQLRNQDVECVEETVVSTSYNVDNKVNAAALTDEQGSDITASFMLENNINNQQTSHLMSKQSFERDFKANSVENVALNQPSSTEYSQKKQCIKPKHKMNIKQNHPSTQLSPINGFLCNKCRRIFKNRARLKRHKRYSLSCSKK